MPNCVDCGASILEGARFCSACGAGQQAPGNLLHEASGSGEAPQAPAQRPLLGLPRQKLVPTLVIAALVLVALLLTVHEVNATKRLQQAKTEASSVLTKLEACQSAVRIGVTQGDLSEKAEEAQKSVLQFKRSEYSSLLPQFTSYAEMAASNYIDSCSNWFDDNKRAHKAWQKAYAKWTPFSGKPAPEIGDFKSDEKYQSDWSMAEMNVEFAGQALSSGK